MSSATSEANLPLLARDGGTRRLLTARSRRRFLAGGDRPGNLGASSILVVGAIHAQQYYEAYFSIVPTIGTLFLLSFIGAGVVRRHPVGTGPEARASALATPIWHSPLSARSGSRSARFVSLLVSEYTPLFGFMESGYRPRHRPHARVRWLDHRLPSASFS